MVKQLGVALFFVIFTSNSYASLVWPMHSGEVWEYTADPTDGSPSWVEHWQFGEEVLLDSQWYFPVGDTYFRSTEDKIFEWEPGLGGTLFFQIAPIGTIWNHSTNNTVEILDDDFLVGDVFGGPYEAYKLKFTDPDGPWYVYVVPEVGIVQWDEFDEVPPHVLKLTNIIPEPASIWLFASGLSYFIAHRRKSQILR